MTPFKYDLFTGFNTLHLPGGACKPSVGNQDDAVKLWNHGDLAKPEVPELFYVAVTGETLPSGYDYEPIGTVLLHHGNFVVHVYGATPQVGVTLL